MASRACIAFRFFEGVTLGHTTLKSRHFHGVPALLGGDEVDRIACDVLRGHVVLLSLVYPPSCIPLEGYAGRRGLSTQSAMPECLVVAPARDRELPGWRHVGNGKGVRWDRMRLVVGTMVTSNPSVVT